MQNIGDIEFELIRRKVKYLRIQVLPPEGLVKVISPLNLSHAIISDFIVKRSSWIKENQIKLRAKSLKNDILFQSGELHLLWGKSYVLRVYDYDGKPSLNLVDDIELRMLVAADSGYQQRLKIFDNYYRNHLNHMLPKFFTKWEQIIQVQSSSFYIRKMKTRWGSCNVVTKRIAINLELAKKPIQCLEYIVVHELVHLLEPSHNARFKGFMDKFLPDWRARKKLLNA